MKTSETIKIISEAISKTQGKLPNVPKRGKSNFGAHATLDDGLEICRKHCSEHGISIIQSTRMDGEIMVLDTRLCCGNEWVEAEYPVIRFPATQQQIGSALTYSRRYSLFAMIGIAGENDDDGDAATTATPAPKREKPSELSAEQSSAILEELLASLKQCVSFTALEEWGEANRGKTANLIKAHKVRIGEEYYKLETSIKQVRKANG
jgi:hypothetical protein